MIIRVVGIVSHGRIVNLHCGHVCRCAGGVVEEGAIINGGTAKVGHS